MSANVRAVIVEPRKHAALNDVVQNMCEQNPQVPVTIVHGTKNADFAHQIAKKNSCVTHLAQLNAPNLNFPDARVCQHGVLKKVIGL